jgi:hypothetical protein
MFASRESRYQAALLAKGRFVGRADLERAAGALPNGHPLYVARADVALADLRRRVGLTTDDGEVVAAARILSDLDLAGHRRNAPALVDDLLSLPHDRRWARVMRALPDSKLPYRYSADLDALYTAAEQVAILVDPAAYARRKGLRASRKVAREGDALATRRPEHAVRVIAKRRLRELIGAFRTSTHGAETHVSSVEPGEEGAKSSTESVAPRDVGLSNAYSRVAYSVTTSSHEWRVSRAILSAEVRALNDAAPRGVVYLRVDLRVRQGRGTSLVVEHRVVGASGRGSWS